MKGAFPYRGAVDAPGHRRLWRSLHLAGQDFMLAVIAALLGQLSDNRSTCNGDGTSQMGLNGQ